MTGKYRCSSKPLNVALFCSFALSCVGMAETYGADITVNIDRTNGDWSDLGIGQPSAESDSDQIQNPSAVFSYVPSYGEPHAEAGAKGLVLPRLNDGKLPRNSDDSEHNTWFDTEGHSRILLDLGQSMNVARVNVYSWHSSALAPQQYTLWATDREKPSGADRADLSEEWKEIATVDTRSLGDGGKHGSSINGKEGKIGRYRYFLFDFPANRPDWSRSGFFSEIDVFQVGRKLNKVTTVVREPGRQILRFGEINLSKPLDEACPFLLAGSKLYEYGAMDGTFPPVGRLDGDQSGIWCHPIKIMNSFAFEIMEEGQNPWSLAGSPSQFVHEFASCKFGFNRNGLKVTRHDFVPEDEPALFSILTLRNDTDRARTLRVQFSGVVNIRPSYASDLPNGRDVVGYRDGMVGAYDSEMPDQWGVVFGSERSPSSHRIAGNRGILRYSLDLPARGEVTSRFLIVGEHAAGEEEARRRFKSLSRQATESLAQKEKLYRDRILGGVKFDCSDKAVTDAFYCAKANVMMSVMDLRPNYKAPFLAAGFPIYTWLFGCDSLYSTPGVVAGGFDEAARGTLECLLYYAQQKKQGAHEVASNGRLLGWDHIQETPQLVLACWQHFKWTGDMEFLKKAYPVCRDSIAHVLATADRDHDGYLEGPGLMEQSGMGPERISSVCYLYAGYESLANMAEVLQRKGDPEEYRRRASALKKRFNTDWWNSREKMWACSLRTDHAQTMDNFWAVAFPQEVGIADLDKALVALDRIENEWVNDKWGFVAQWKPSIADEGVGVVHNNILAKTAFRYGRADLGWKLIQLSVKAPRGERMLGAFDETMPGGGDLMQLWSFGPFLEAVIGGLAGVHPTASKHTVEIYPHVPAALEHFRLHGLEVGEHRLDLEWRRDGKASLMKVAHRGGPQSLNVLFRVSTEQAQTISMNDAPVRTETEMQHGIKTARVASLLQPGESVEFRSEK